MNKVCVQDIKWTVTSGAGLVPNRGDISFLSPNIFDDKQEGTTVPVSTVSYDKQRTSQCGAV